jgi:hypothetical protein
MATIGILIETEEGKVKGTNFGVLTAACGRSGSRACTFPSGRETSETPPGFPKSILRPSGESDGPP